MNFSSSQEICQKYLKLDLFLVSKNKQVPVLQGISCPPVSEEVRNTESAPISNVNILPQHHPALRMSTSHVGKDASHPTCLLHMENSLSNTLPTQRLPHLLSPPYQVLQATKINLLGTLCLWVRNTLFLHVKIYKWDEYLETKAKTYHPDRLRSKFAQVVRDGPRAKMSVEWTHFENRDLFLEDGVNKTCANV